MLLWLFLITGCGGGVGVQLQVREGEQLEAVERLQNTVRTIERGIILEEVQQRWVRDTVTAGTLGKTDVAWTQKTTSARVKRSMGGRDATWDSRVDDAPPQALAGAESILDVMSETHVSASGEVLIREGTSEVLFTGVNDAAIHERSGAVHLDIVDAGMLSAPVGLREGTVWQTRLAATTHFEHEDHESEITVNWMVDRISGDTVLLGHTMASVGRLTPKAKGFVLSRAAGKGTLLIDAKRGVPLEYSEDVTYTMASVDSEIDQKIQRRREYETLSE